MPRGPGVGPRWLDGVIMADGDHRIASRKERISLAGMTSSNLPNGKIAGGAAYLTTTSCSTFLSVTGKLTPGYIP